MATRESPSSLTLEQRVEYLEFALTTFWLLFGAALTFMVHTGYAMITVGCAQAKNTKNILVTNVFDASMGSLLWWWTGFGIAMGEDNYPEDGKNGVIGTSGYGLAGNQFRGSLVPQTPVNWALWLVLWAFAGQTATIAAGAVAERITFNAYIIYSMVFIAFIYPMLMHWVWSYGGWASSYRDTRLLFNCGAADFAGSGVTHMAGGLAGLIGAAMLGYRRGRFIEGVPRELPQVSWVYQTLGTLILWFGWFGLWFAWFGLTRFTDDSIPQIDSAAVAARAMVNSAIAAGSSCLTAVLWGRGLNGTIQPENANNGILSGLVALSASAPLVEPEGAFVIGIVGGSCYFGASWLLIRLMVDDVVNAVPVHLFAGMWGLFAAGLFTTSTYYDEVYPYGRGSDCAGAFYGGSGRLLAANVVVLLVILGWVGVTVGFVMWVAKMTVGLRVTEDIETVGLDLSKHGGVFPLSSQGIPSQLQHLAALHGVAAVSSSARNSFTNFNNEPGEAKNANQEAGHAARGSGAGPGLMAMVGGPGKIK